MSAVLVPLLMAAQIVYLAVQSQILVDQLESVVWKKLQLPHTYICRVGTEKSKFFR